MLEPDDGLDFDDALEVLAELCELPEDVEDDPLDGLEPEDVEDDPLDLDETLDVLAELGELPDDGDDDPLLSEALDWLALDALAPPELSEDFDDDPELPLLADEVLAELPELLDEVLDDRLALDGLLVEEDDNEIPTELVEDEDDDPLEMLETDEVLALLGEDPDDPDVGVLWLETLERVDVDGLETLDVDALEILAELRLEWLDSDRELREDAELADMGVDEELDRLLPPDDVLALDCEWLAELWLDGVEAEDSLDDSLDDVPRLTHSQMTSYWRLKTHVSLSDMPAVDSPGITKEQWKRFGWLHSAAASARYSPVTRWSGSKDRMRCSMADTRWRWISAPSRMKDRIWMLTLTRRTWVP